MYRTNKDQRLYNKLKIANKTTNTCSLCDLSKNQIIYQNDDLTLVHNKFPYSYWENRKVIDQLMIVPKHHSKDLSGLSSKTKEQIFNVILEYESKGYDIYLRGVGSSSRSVAEHVHVHLIKTEQKIANINISIEKPYFLFVK